MDVQTKNRDGQTALDLVKDSASPEVMGIFAPYVYAARGPEGLPSLPEASFTQVPVVSQQPPDDGLEDEQKSLVCQDDGQSYEVDMNEPTSVFSDQPPDDGFGDEQKSLVCQDDGQSYEVDMTEPTSVFSDRGVDTACHTFSDPEEEAVWHRLVKILRDRETDKNANIVADTETTLSLAASIPVVRARPTDHFAPPDSSIADTDASDENMSVWREATSIWHRVVKILSDRAEDITAIVGVNTETVLSLAASNPFRWIRPIDNFAPLDSSTADTDTSLEAKFVWQDTTSSKQSSNHEDYSAFFTPIEFLNKPNDQVKTTSANADADIEIVTVEPKRIHDLFKSPAFSLTDTDDQVIPSKLSFPWQVPKLRLVEPTPPSSRGSDPCVPERGHWDVDLKASNKKITWFSNNETGNEQDFSFYITEEDSKEGWRNNHALL